MYIVSELLMYLFLVFKCSESNIILAELIKML